MRLRSTWLAAVVLVVLAPTAAPQGPAANAGKGVYDWGRKVAEDLYKREGHVSGIKKDFDTLDEADRDADPEYPPGPGIPSACVDNPEACESCEFEQTVEKLQKTRYALEKLRRIYAGTKNLVAHSLTFGDAMANSAGVGGLAWVAERKKIVASFGEVKVKYDAKYEELMAKLNESLKQLAECEEKMYGERDWYERYGFMYYEFMAAFYRRVD